MHRLTDQCRLKGNPADNVGQMMSEMADNVGSNNCGGERNEPSYIDDDLP